MVCPLQFGLVDWGAGYPTPRVFWKKRLELLENTGFDFFGEGKEAASRWSGKR
jgi:hypothetical protein